MEFKGTRQRCYRAPVRVIGAEAGLCRFSLWRICVHQLLVECIAGKGEWRTELCVACCTLAEALCVCMPVDKDREGFGVCFLREVRMAERIEMFSLESTYSCVV